MNVVVYIRAADARALTAKGKDPALWVRGLVAYALQKELIPDERVQGTAPERDAPRT